MRKDWMTFKEKKKKFLNKFWNGKKKTKDALLKAVVENSKRGSFNFPGRKNFFLFTFFVKSEMGKLG